MYTLEQCFLNGGIHNPRATLEYYRGYLRFYFLNLAGKLFQRGYILEKFDNHCVRGKSAAGSKGNSSNSREHFASLKNSFVYTDVHTETYRNSMLHYIYILCNTSLVRFVTYKIVNVKKRTVILIRWGCVS